MFLRMDHCTAPICSFCTRCSIP